MTEGMVAKWHVSAGTKVSPGDLIADIETSKITIELEVYTAGVIRGELAKEGIDILVGALMGVIADEAVTNDEVDQFIANFVPEDGDSLDVFEDARSETRASDQPITRVDSKPIADRSSAAAVSIPESLKSNDDDRLALATHLARKLARQFGINLNKIAGSGRRGRISKKDIELAVNAAGGNLAPSTQKVSSVEVNMDDSHIAATPLARRMAARAGMNLATITASGTRSRVTKSDVENAIATSSSTPTKQSIEISPVGTFEEVPLSSMRRIIARRLTESKQNAPHFRLVIEANIEQMLNLRTDLNQEIENGKISVNDLLIKAVAKTLVKVPDVNIQFDGDVIRRFADVDISVVVALKEGLVTPIVRAADKKKITDISREMTELVRRAKSGSLSLDEFEGGTFTLSNLGMFGIKAFDAIINPPQAAILAVGAGEKRRIFAGNREITATMMTATLSCDHRVIDGATGARFMQTLKEVIEHPFRMLM